MFSNSGILFFTASVMTLLTVEAIILRPSHAMEREGTCTKILSQECAGARDVIPLSYPNDTKEIDKACSAASSYFPCFEKFASTCEPEDVQSRYLLTYLDICDSSKPLYDGMRKSIRCLKLVEKKYEENCIQPIGNLIAELTDFRDKAEDFGISPEVWDKIEFGLMALQEHVCSLKVADECNEEFVDTVNTLFEQLGFKALTAILSVQQTIVEKVLDILNLDDNQKMELKQNIV